MQIRCNEEYINISPHSIGSISVNITLYLEDGRGVEPRRQDPRVYATELCLNAKTTNDAYQRFTTEPDNSICAGDLIISTTTLLLTNFNLILSFLPLSIFLCWFLDLVVFLKINYN